MKDEINFSYNGGGDAYPLQSVAIHFNHTVSVSTVISQECTKLLIVMDTDSLGGQEPENETNNFDRCTLGDTVLN